MSWGRLSGTIVVDFASQLYPNAVFTSRRGDLTSRVRWRNKQWRHVSWRRSSPVHPTPRVLEFRTPRIVASVTDATITGLFIYLCNVIQIIYVYGYQRMHAHANLCLYWKWHLLRIEEFPLPLRSHPGIRSLSVMYFRRRKFSSTV